MTKTTTLTEAECHALTVRGDVPGVLDGYVGPVIWGGRTERIALVRVHHDHALVVDDGTGDMTHWAPSLDLRLPLASPLVQAHLAGWLGRGERCPCDGKPVACCIGCGHYPGDLEVRKPCAGNDAGHAWIDRDCERCNGTGYLRPPHNRYAWLLPEAHGGLPDRIRLALIWGSVVRVAAGMGALNLKPVESLGFTNTRCAFFHWAGEDCCWADTDEGDNDYGWTYGTDHGPERGDAAIECLHRLALARGYALIDNTPAGRVMRFEVPDADL